MPLSNYLSFRASVLEAMRVNRPAEYFTLEAEIGGDQKTPFFSRVSVSTLFERSGELDSPETHEPLADMIHSMVGKFDQSKDWLYDGGSPLTATMLTSAKIANVEPILGYRHSLIEAIQVAGITYIPPEQWEVGVNPAMMASSLIRGFVNGSLRMWNFRQGDVPSSVMKAFRDPTVEQGLRDFLSEQTIGNGNAGRTIKNAWFRELLYVFIHFDLPELVDAISRSHAFKSDRTEPEELITALLINTLYDDNPNLERLLEFIDRYIGLKPDDPLVDKVFAGKLGGNGLPGRDNLRVYMLGRLSDLREAGCVELAAPWLSNLAPLMADTFAFSDSEKHALRGTLNVDEDANLRFMSSLFGDENKGIPFLVELLGVTGFSQAIGKACVSSLKKDLHKNRHMVRYTGVIDERLLVIDIDSLKSSGALHAALDGFYKAYTEVWGKSMHRLQKAEDLDPPEHWAIEQVKVLATWVGQALSADPCRKRALQWYKRLKYPFAQDALVFNLPMDKDFLKQINAEALGRKFSNDLGL